MCSLNIVVINYDVQFFLGLKDRSGYLEIILIENFIVDIEIFEEEINGLYFDCILCDVLCSGDGIFRKVLDIWRKWYDIFVLYIIF